MKTVFILQITLFKIITVFFIHLDTHTTKFLRVRSSMRSLPAAHDYLVCLLDRSERITLMTITLQTSAV